VCNDCRAHEVVVQTYCILHCVTIAGPAPCAALDVAKQEVHGPTWQLNLKRRRSVLSFWSKMAADAHNASSPEPRTRRFFVTAEALLRAVSSPSRAAHDGLS
jgi:hypothetical protein